MKTAKWIRDRRAAAGLTQAELGRKVGASQPMISLWERGASEPPADILKKLRTALDGNPVPPKQSAPKSAPQKEEPGPLSREAGEGRGGGASPRRGKSARRNASGASLDFKDKLWAAADRLRGHMDPADYKYVVLGLIFLKYISDSFEELHAKLERDPDADAEDRDHYLAENVFWVPREARWSKLKTRAKSPEIGKAVDDAMVAIERENPSLRGVLPKDFGRPSLDKARLGELVDLVSTIGLGQGNGSQDVLGRVYEYFLGRFAAAEGKSGGQFFTPECVVNLLVEMIEPFQGRVYDPCFGSGGMFVSSRRFVVAHGGRRDDIAIYGQESNHNTWKLGRMNLAIRGIEADLGSENADSFLRDLHPDLRADFILANPPFNMSYWGGDRLRDDARWRKFGVPPANNANYAWIQHFIHHLSPRGVAGFVMANGSMSSSQSGEGEIRKKIIEADLVDCMIALPPQLFYTTPIPACLWFLARNKVNGKFRDRREETLFIDARKMGHLVDRTHRELSDKEIKDIARTYHAWRGEKGAGKYEDVPGRCKAATTEEIAEHGYVLTPGQYVGATETEDEAELFEHKMRRLVSTLGDQFAESAKLEKLILDNLGRLGYGK